MADLLCLDRGNSGLKGLLYDGNCVVARPKFDENWRRALARMPLDKIDVALCSVAPSRDKELRAFFSEKGVDVWTLRGDSEVPFPVDIRGRETLGADRLANMAFAYLNRRYPAIVVDAGSAVTLDLMDAEGRYRGGLIIPGPRLWLQGLAEGGELLPAVDLVPDIPLLGLETREALAAGAVWGLREAVQGLIVRLGALIEEPVSVILTGGAAPLLAEAWRGEAPSSERDWTLQGLAGLYRWNHR
ncbi:type III pantothenate kinase [bacterium]|nr:type III pantothenate kinase [bacterium]